MSTTPEPPAFDDPALEQLWCAWVQRCGFNPVQRGAHLDMWRALCERGMGFALKIEASDILTQDDIRVPERILGLRLSEHVKVLDRGIRPPSLAPRTAQRSEALRCGDLIELNDGTWLHVRIEDGHLRTCLPLGPGDARQIDARERRRQVRRIIEAADIRSVCDAEPELRAHLSQLRKERDSWLERRGKEGWNEHQRAVEQTYARIEEQIQKVRERQYAQPAPLAATRPRAAPVRQGRRGDPLERLLREHAGYLPGMSERHGGAPTYLRVDFSAEWSLLEEAVLNKAAELRSGRWEQRIEARSA